MNKERLQTLRIVIPGLIGLLLSIPLFTDNLTISSITTILSSFSVKDIPFLIIVPILGVLYYLLNIRSFIQYNSLQDIQSNLKDQLLLPFQEDALIGNASIKLRQSSMLLDVFYRFVDNDESLKERAKSVYLNGLILSSLADMTGLGIIFALLYFIAYPIMTTSHYPIVGSISLFLAFLSLLLIPIATKRHIELGNKQIQFIIIHEKDALHKKLIELANSVSST